MPENQTPWHRRVPEERAPGAAFEPSEADAFFHALGQFMVTFSHAQLMVELGAEMLVGQSDEQLAQVAVLLAGDRGAEASRSWASMHALLKARLTKLKKDDQASELKDLNKAMKLLIEERNTIAHSAWFLRPASNLRDTPSGAALLLRLRPGGEHKRLSYDLDKLLALTDELKAWVNRFLKLWSSVLDQGRRDAIMKALQDADLLDVD